jgi:two-component system response regulator AtoC
MTSSSRPMVLLVDDDPAIGTVLTALLEQEGIASRHVSSGDHALAALEAEPFDLVLTDLKMPNMDGMRLLEIVKQRWPNQQVIILSAHGTIPLAVRAMQLGASDFLLKPFDADEVTFVARKALALGARGRDETPPPPASAHSPVMQEIEEMISRAARSSATVLVLGESGTGKERVARAIHSASDRRDNAFIAIHCAALPEALLESELFGHEKGAFTGAIARKPGRVELADGGTLFLDEVGDIPMSMQVKLLRLLQERQFERLGSTRTIDVDVRIVAATHRDLASMIESGAFREDFYYRLSVVPIHLPPLRERPGEAERLAEQIFAAQRRANQKPNFTLDPAAVGLLGAQRWPGNVRQLQNFIERLIVLSDGPEIGVADVGRELAREASWHAARSPHAVHAGDLKQIASQSRRAERDALEHALKSAGNNRTLAARLLGISRRTLYNKLEEHNLC